MSKRTLLLFLCSALVWGCATAPATPPQTQLQIREFQTRTYETSDVRLVMKALLNALQDEYFIVKNADADLGLLTATKEVDVESKSEAFWSAFLAGENARWKKNSIIECSANVSDYGTQTKVRVNFQMKLMDNKGGVLEVKQVEDATYYQNFFSKVDKSIFIQKEKL